MMKLIVTAEQLGRLARKQSELFRRVCEGALKVESVLDALQHVIEGDFENHVIDCDAEPFVPDGWKVEKHKPGGQFTWDLDRVGLYLSKEQREVGNYIDGKGIRRELERRPALNANVLDYLLEHTELIPEDWKDKEVSFWGTVYRDCDKRGLWVRYLYWDSGWWRCNLSWIDRAWYGSSPAAILID